MTETIERVAKAIQAKCLERGYRECPAPLVHHVAGAAIEATQVWQGMDSAPTGEQILVRRHNDCFYEYFVVWYSDEDENYPWRTDHNAYPTDRLDAWLAIPGGEQVRP